MVDAQSRIGMDLGALDLAGGSLNRDELTASICCAYRAVSVGFTGSLRTELFLDDMHV